MVAEVKLQIERKSSKYEKAKAEQMKKMSEYAYENKEYEFIIVTHDILVGLSQEDSLSQSNTPNELLVSQLPIIKTDKYLKEIVGYKQ